MCNIELVTSMLVKTMNVRICVKVIEALRLPFVVNLVLCVVLPTLYYPLGLTMSSLPVYLCLPILSPT
ncbi:hypothetical protein Hanom_Chr11g01036231 [Helianthus anomalus]